MRTILNIGRALSFSGTVVGIQIMTRSKEDFLVGFLVTAMNSYSFFNLVYREKHV